MSDIGPYEVLKFYAYDSLDNILYSIVLHQKL